MLQTRSRMCFTRGGTLKMDGKIDEILDRFCYVVFSSTMIVVSRNVLRFSFLSV